jgi:hypothetical protein
LAPKLASADARARDLSKRLSEYFASDASRALSILAETARSTAGASGDGINTGNANDGVGEAIGNHLAACSRDGVRLNGWREWYEGLPQELKQ